MDIIITLAVLFVLAIGSAAVYYHLETVRRIKRDARLAFREEMVNAYHRGYANGMADEKSAQEKPKKIDADTILIPTSS